MLRKLTSLLLSLLLSLSLLPGQARAADEPELPEEPAVVMSEEVPGTDSDYHTW